MSIVSPIFKVERAILYYMINYHLLLRIVVLSRHFFVCLQICHVVFLFWLKVCFVLFFSSVFFFLLKPRPFDQSFFVMYTLRQSHARAVSPQLSVSSFFSSFFFVS